MVTLRQFRYFTTLAETGHFGEAAHRCAVTQPALSVQIKELERELGVPLVERRSSGATLTVEGAEVARRARAILSSVRDLQDFAAQSTQLGVGPLRLGAIPTIAPYIMPDVLGAISQRFQRLELSLRESVTDTLVGALVQGELDAIVAALPLHHSEIETIHLFDDAFLLAEPASLPNRERPTKLSDLDAEKLLLLEEGHCLRDQALSVCRGRGAQTLPGFGASSLTTILRMVAHGYGVTLLPEMAVGSDTDVSKIRLSRFAKPEPSRQICLAWRKNSPRREELARLADVIRGLYDHSGRDVVTAASPRKRDNVRIRTAVTEG